MLHCDIQAGAKVARHRLTLTRRLLRQSARLQNRMQPHWESMRSLLLKLTQKFDAVWQVCSASACAHEREFARYVT